MPDDLADYRAGLIIVLVAGCLVGAYGMASALNPFSHDEAAEYACYSEPVPSDYDGIPEGVAGVAYRPPINGYFCTYLMKDGRTLVVQHYSAFGLITAAVGSGIMALSGAGLIAIGVTRTRRNEELANPNATAVAPS